MTILYWWLQVFIEVSTLAACVWTPPSLLWALELVHLLSPWQLFFACPCGVSCDSCRLIFRQKSQEYSLYWFLYFFLFFLLSSILSCKFQLLHTLKTSLDLFNSVRWLCLLGFVHSVPNSQICFQAKSQKDSRAHLIHFLFLTYYSHAHHVQGTLSHVLLVFPVSGTCIFSLVF